MSGAWEVMMARSAYDDLRKQQAAMDTLRPIQSGYAELKSQQAAMDTPRPKQSGYAELKSTQRVQDAQEAARGLTSKDPALRKKASAKFNNNNLYSGRVELYPWNGSSGSRP